jgi:hypothetical protein
MKKIILIICVLFIISCRDNESKLYPSKRPHLNDTSDAEIIIIGGDVFYM